MGQFGHSRVEFHRGGVPRLALGTINLIFARPGSDVRASSKVMSVGGGPELGARNQAPKRNRVMVHPTMGFSKEDKEGTFQPHDDALVVTIRIGGYDIKRVLVD